MATCRKFVAAHETKNNSSLNLAHTTISETLEDRTSKSFHLLSIFSHEILRTPRIPICFPLSLNLRSSFHSGRVHKPMLDRKGEKWQFIMQILQKIKQTGVQMVDM